jgi:protein-tyrosine phosphatase
VNILFVCTGNINRSPAAEIIYRALSPHDKVTSAALHNKKSLITSKRMREALEKSGYKYTEIRSKPVTQALIDWADVVFYMQPSHLKELQKFGVSRKYFPLSKFINQAKIHDPAFDSSHPMVVYDIERAIRKFLISKKIIPICSLELSLFI